jgi:RNA polymerase sigma-70 factor (ECF subfamily)
MSLEQGSTSDLATGNGRAGGAAAGPLIASLASPTEGSTASRVQHQLDIPAMLQTLSPDHRQVVVLREIEQLSYQQIADVLGVPRGTVESRLHRARQELKQRFADYLT